MPECLFLIYHNVKSPVMKGHYDLKGTEMAFFRKQLDFLCEHYEPVTADILIESIEDKSKLPSKCFYLTFDDGYKEQSLLVAYELLSRGIKGSFFSNTYRLEEKKLIAVDKQRFLLYATDSFRAYLINFCKAIKQFYPGLYNEKFELTPENVKDASNFYSECLFYSDEERFYRKIRDVYLNEDQCRFIIDYLFPKYFSNERALVEDYFMNWDDLKYLVEKGMDVGCHTHSHPLLTRLDYRAQKSDIHKNKEILSKKLGIEIKSISYPYGKCNTDTVKAVKEEGLKLGFVVDGEVERSALEDPYRISRLYSKILEGIMENFSNFQRRI